MTARAQNPGAHSELVLADRLRKRRSTHGRAISYACSRAHIYAVSHVHAPADAFPRGFAAPASMAEGGGAARG